MLRSEVLESTLADVASGRLRMTRAALFAALL
jgi:hypothetical protein